MKCYYCKKKINEDHDTHYYCKCGATIKVVCTHCYLSHPKCLSCKKVLKHHEDSILKKAYSNPATRGGLGL